MIPDVLLKYYNVAVDVQSEFASAKSFFGVQRLSSSLQEQQFSMAVPMQHGGEQSSNTRPRHSTAVDRRPVLSQKTLRNETFLKLRDALLVNK